MTKVLLMRRVYPTKRDCDNDLNGKDVFIGFTPCTMDEAITLRSKCTDYPKSRYVVIENQETINKLGKMYSF